MTRIEGTCGLKFSKVPTLPEIEKNNASTYWMYETNRRTKRKLPLVPAVFNRQIQTRSFTDGSDQAFVMRLYEQTFRCVRLQGGLEPLSRLKALWLIDLEACSGLEGTLDDLVGLRKLLKLNMSDTHLLGAEAFAAKHLGGMGKCQVGRVAVAHEQTPLWISASVGQLRTARLLLEAGVEADRASTDTGVTPLNQASREGFAGEGGAALGPRGRC